MPRVSVVTAAYNASAFIDETIGAILAQTFADFELIVVDDASTDDTVSKIARYRDSRIRLIRNPTNVGVARARNIGVAAAAGEFLAANDHDDVSLPNRLARQVAFLDGAPEILTLGTGIYTLRGGRRFADPVAATEHHVIRWCLMTHSPICHSTMCTRLAKIREFSLSYDPTCDFGDDFDLYHRMAAVGRLANLPERLVAYRVHGGNASLLRGSDMSARGASMLARAHERYLGARLDTNAFNALWRVVTFFEPAQDRSELLLVGQGLTTLLERYLNAVELSDAERAAVKRAASRQWWDAVNRSAVTLGQSALDEFERFEQLGEFRPTAALRLRNRLARTARSLFPSLVR